MGDPEPRWGTTAPPVGDLPPDCHGHVGPDLTHEQPWVEPAAPWVRALVWFGLLAACASCWGVLIWWVFS